MGNTLMQSVAMGEVGSLQEGCGLIRHSFDLESFETRNDSRTAWDQAYERLLGLPSL